MSQENVELLRGPVGAFNEREVAPMTVGPTTVVPTTLAAGVRERIPSRRSFVWKSISLTVRLGR